jgi:hypothetical protein
METAMLTRPRPGRRSLVAAVPWPTLALAGLALATAIGFVVYPTYPNYDSSYSLIWGREILDGTLPSFDAYRAPTQHPLAIVFGAALSLLGEVGDRVMVAATLVSFVVLCAGLYRLGKASFGTLVGLIAGGLLCTRFDFPFLAARAYVDIAYLAFVVWAVALEADRPRRGLPIMVLLAGAGLMRPEAWLLSGLYFLWWAWPRRRRPLALAPYAALSVVGPVVWVLTDWIVTGDPLFSHTHTSGLAEELGRSRGIGDVPSATVEFLRRLAKAPVMYAGLVGLVLAVVLVPRRALMTIVVLVVGLATFVLVGLAGLSVIDRYLLVPSLMVMVLAAFTLGGFTVLRQGLFARRVWMVLAALLVVYGVVFTATRVNFGSFHRELKLRGSTHAALVDLLDDPAVAAGRRCGPVSLPNHKLVPETRWILDASEREVIARADPDAKARAAAGGVAIYVITRAVLLRQALVEDADDPLDSVPLPDFLPVARSEHFAAYVRC